MTIQFSIRHVFGHVDAGQALGTAFALLIFLYWNNETIDSSQMDARWNKGWFADSYVLNLQVLRNIMRTKGIFKVSIKLAGRRSES